MAKLYSKPTHSKNSLVPREETIENEVKRFGHHALAKGFFKL